MKDAKVRAHKWCQIFRFRMSYFFFVFTIKATASLARTSQAWKNEALFFCLKKLTPLLLHRVVNILLIRFSLLESFVRLLSRIL